MPIPEGPIVVGIDSGYIRARDGTQSHFEILVGKSIPEDRDNRYFGLVQSHDDKLRRRLHEVLREQGFQMNRDITFLTDGGDSVRNIAVAMSRCAEHVLDWFHITMRLTVLGQYAKGLAHHNPRETENAARELRRIKGYLWNGNHRQALPCIEWLIDNLDAVETEYSGMKAFRKAADEFHTYIVNNAGMIPDYAERRRYGEAGLDDVRRVNRQRRSRQTLFKATADAMVKEGRISLAPSSHAYTCPITTGLSRIIAKSSGGCGRCWASSPFLRQSSRWPAFRWFT